MRPEFYWLAVALTTTVSASRMTRLATWDHFPPVKWARDKYADATDASDMLRGWQILAFCGYCASFWITAVIVGWGYLAGVYNPHTSATSPVLVWWLLNGVLASSYLAAILMANDGDDGEDD